MRITRNPAAAWNSQHLISLTRGSRRRPFIRTPNRKCFVGGRKACSQSSGPSSLPLLFAPCRDQPDRNSILRSGVRLYHTSSKNAALEHQPPPSSREPFLVENALPSRPQDRRANGALSTRDRLRQWRSETDGALSFTEGGNPAFPNSSGRGSPQIQIDTPNSLSAQTDDEEPGEQPGQVEEDLDLELDSDYDESMLIMQPGDLALYNIPGRAGKSGELCVFARLVNGQSQFITRKGYWYATNAIAARSCRVSNFVSPEELADLLPFLPSETVKSPIEGPIAMLAKEVGDIPIDVAEAVVKKVVHFGAEMEAFRRRHALAFEGLYEKLAHDTELTEWSFEELVPKVFGFSHTELPSAGLLALDIFIGAHQGLYSQRLEGKPDGYWVRSRQDIRLKEEVVDWARMYRESAAKAAVGEDVKEELRKNPLGAFINKAHRLILTSRKNRSPTTIGALGPSADRSKDGMVTAVMTGETLSKSDKQILHFLFEVLQKKPGLVPGEARAICALIYRAIGAYPNLDLGSKVGRLLLQELGAISPWHDDRLNSYRNRLPGLGFWAYQTRLLEKAEACCEDLSVFRDRVRDGARRDWGETPVYCIDSADAMEIDDGLSVERDTVRTDCVWIHIHVANPAAYISPDDPIAAAAKDSLASTYTPSRIYRMMPGKFAQAVASLGADRPVMTVSTLIRPDGSVADIQISLGIIHKVIKLTPTRVAEALGGNNPDMATMVIGGARPADADDDSDPEAVRQALPDLSLMQEFLHYRYSRRTAEWPEQERLKRQTGYVRCQVWTTFREEEVPPSPDKLAHWRGDPIIVVEGNRFPSVAEDFHSMPLVDHAMLLTGESAAKWCRERQIPIIYHVATPHPYYPVPTLNQLADNEFRIEPQARMSGKAQAHWHLNMPQYTKMTSPIRRFPDLLNQWQIQAYLEGEHDEMNGNRTGPVSDALSRLPLSGEEVERFSAKAGARSIALRQVKNLNMQRWTYMALFRALHFKEAELPEVWDMKVTSAKAEAMRTPDHTGLLGTLTPFGIRLELLRSVEGWEQMASKGQFIPVKLELVDPDKEQAFARAVGAPRDELCTKQPIHIQSSSPSASAT